MPFRDEERNRFMIPFMQVFTGDWMVSMQGGTRGTGGMDVLKIAQMRKCLRYVMPYSWIL